MLDALHLDSLPHGGEFEQALRNNGWEKYAPVEIEIFQINIGKLCNMTCRHCHVDAGPDRVEENMDRRTIDACLAALDKTNATMVDITGGAPELNPHFRYLVEECVKRGKHVMNRCNLTILTVPKYSDLPAFFADNNVEIVCSLPHYRRRNTDAQRGDGTYEKSIKALEMLNEVGYGKGDPKKRLTLVSNPAGAFLSGSQASMEAEWKAALQRNYGLTFDRLITINNLPISRYLEWLEESGNLQGYMELLVNSFNPNTLCGLMCRNTLSVSWDGRLYDCDFNQMLDLELQTNDDETLTIFEFDPERLRDREIVTGRHCFGCAAGAGSSCGGAIET
jgi:radical SAM/Cys-rich protein